MRHVVFDTNYWKSFVHARLAVAMGDRGCLSLFGDKPELHRLFAEHLTAEYRVKTEGRGRTVDEWKLRPEASDNHWLDCLVGCAVAASIQGAVLAGTDVKAAAATPRIRAVGLCNGGNDKWPTHDASKTASEAAGPGVPALRLPAHLRRLHTQHRRAGSFASANAGIADGGSRPMNSPPHTTATFHESANGCLPTIVVTICEGTHQILPELRFVGRTCRTVIDDSRWSAGQLTT